MRHAQFSARWFRKALVLTGTLALMMAAVACSHNSQPAEVSSRPSSASLHSTVLQNVAQTVTQPAPGEAAQQTSSMMKPPSSQLILFRSRDYGVSFLYPWQYAFVSAKALSEDDSAVQPKSDGHDGQFTLARVEVPRGFYPDTDFEDGYFTLSLNQDLSEQDCQAALGAAKDVKIQTDTINGVEFHWIETETGGHGEAATIRDYSGFANATCYELEMGVKTRNDQGLAREVDADQVFRRLNRILRTVKIVQQTQNVAEPATKTSSEPPSATDTTE